MEKNIETLYDLVEKMYVELKGDIGGLKEDVSGLKKNVSGLKEDVGSIKSRLDRLENVVTNIEHDHGEKLRILFDGYRMNREKLEYIHQDIISMKRMLNEHDITIKSLRIMVEKGAS